ncbi:MAG: DUF2336 domain-containing protein [Bdellovibrionales bacterium]
MTTTLTQADVAKLLAEPSPHVRAELAGKLAVEIDSPRLTETEVALAQDIVRAMVRDVEVSVRQALAQSLRKAARIPHDAALKLAQDIESVALPMLEHSQVLTDDDLAEIVRSGGASKQETIAGRPLVSEKVSEAIISSAGEKAVATLMENAGAKISDLSYNKAVDRFAQSDVVKEKMVKRDALPVTVAERLVTLVSESLKDYLVSHHELSPNVAANLVLQSRERTVINLSGGSSEEELEKLVTQMYRNKRLTPSIVLRALCMGDVSFFEVAMAVLANVPLINARILIHDAGRLGLKQLYLKTSLPQRLLPAVRVAIDVVHETPLDGGEHDRERYQARVIERVLTQYEDFASDDLDYLLDKLGDVIGTGGVRLHSTE